MPDQSRRDFLGLLGAAGLVPFGRPELPDSQPAHAAPGPPRVVIRTITAGVHVADIGDLRRVEGAIAFLARAKRAAEDAGYEVQTVRIATQPLAAHIAVRERAGALAGLQALDRAASAQDVSLSIGPVLVENRYDADFAPWVAELVSTTRNLNLSVAVASPIAGVNNEGAQCAAEAILAIARSTTGGEGNFRFAAAANCPPGIPFFPVAYHQGQDAFGLGLQSASLLSDAFAGATTIEEAKGRLRAALERPLAMVEKLAVAIAGRERREYLGIDVSPAPMKDNSIGAAVETLTRVPFGSASTLFACAAITDVLKGVRVRTCGYSGLMLPVLEDSVLAKRAAEGRYSVKELLVYSSVCGTGLDTVPLPGNVSAATLAALIGDVAALSAKLHKPLSVRLFPVPGKAAGDAVRFDSPYLTDSIAMPLD